MESALQKRSSDGFPDRKDAKRFAKDLNADAPPFVGWDVIFSILSRVLRVKFGNTPFVPLLCKKTWEWYRNNEKLRIEALLREREGTYQAYVACIWFFCDQGPFVSINRDPGLFAGDEFGPQVIKYEGCLTKRRANGIEFFRFSRILLDEDYAPFNRFFLPKTGCEESWKEYPRDHIIWFFIEEHVEGVPQDEVWCNYSKLPDEFIPMIFQDEKYKNQLCDILKEFNKVVGFF